MLPWFLFSSKYSGVCSFVHTVPGAQHFSSVHVISTRRIHRRHRGGPNPEADSGFASQKPSELRTLRKTRNVCASTLLKNAFLHCSGASRRNCTEMSAPRPTVESSTDQLAPYLPPIWRPVSSLHFPGKFLGCEDHCMRRARGKR